ncbi:MAG TPA: hypothetical protein DCM08_01330 [Microscillaceae bacterium]|jgi:hypothetical protein|nr:hypothetical protein [Microscillaceae bacterium]
MLGWFKKKKDEEVKRHYDPGNVRLFQMRKGSFVDYDFKTWEVRAWYEYDWGNDYFTDEFQLNDGSETINLYVAMNGDDAECSISTPIRLRELDGDVASYIKRNDTAPPEVLYKDENTLKSTKSRVISAILIPTATIGLNLFLGLITMKPATN